LHRDVDLDGIETENLSNLPKKDVKKDKKDVKKDKNDTKNVKKLTKKDEKKLIDDFIVAEAKIIPDKNYEPKNNIQQVDIQMIENDLFSEKLAQIYIKQQHYDRAIEIYKKLNLKFPEKNVYFALQIKKIEELKNNS
jgi:predicted Zn-dependent protease